MKYIQKLKKITRHSNIVVGLDVDINKIPKIFSKYKYPALAFNKAIISATNDKCAGYKLNLAFYESLGKDCHNVLSETLKVIPENLIAICDAKRGDISNTDEFYAREYFDNLNFDAITVSPYMGIDSIKPFLDRKNKFVYVLGLTSNAGASDFQKIKAGNKYLYEIVIEKFLKENKNQNIGFVFGANYTKEIRKYTSAGYNLPLLIPGVGAQGGDLQSLIKNLKNDLYLINSSRGIIYSAEMNDSLYDVKRKAQNALHSMHQTMDVLKEY